MTRLYKKAILNLEESWPARYKDICARVQKVTNWCDASEAPYDLICRLIYDTDNGISSVGQAFSTWPNPRPVADKYRDMLQHLKIGLCAKFPSDEVRKCREEFKTLSKNKGPDSIFNRVVSAFLPGVVSPVMFEDDFDDACAKLVKGGYVQPVKVRIGEDPWHSKNVQLMKQLRERLPDGSCADARWTVDDYTRGVFVWGVHVDINMDDWIILRER